MKSERRFVSLVRTRMSNWPGEWVEKGEGDVEIELAEETDSRLLKMSEGCILLLSAAPY